MFLVPLMLLVVSNEDVKAVYVYSVDILLFYRINLEFSYFLKSWLKLVKVKHTLKDFHIFCFSFSEH